jgi:ribosome-binding ATPase YchF (GTP1/OBG family)
LKKSKKKGDVGADRLLALLERAIDSLDRGESLKELFVEERQVADNLGLITAKPLLCVVEEDEGTGCLRESLRELLDVYESCEREEWESYCSEFGLAPDFPKVLVERVFSEGDRILFFTVGKDEVRGWDVRRGSTALEVAGRIHSDMRRGFIKLEVARWEDVVECGGWEGAVRRKRVKLKDRDYVVEDGDVVVVRFNV